MFTMLALWENFFPNNSPGGRSLKRNALAALLPLLVGTAWAQVAGTPDGAITGRLLSIDGAPLAGIRISAIAAVVSDGGRPSSSSILSLAETDSSGRFRLENVPPGRYNILAGRLDTPSYYPGTPLLSGATTVAVVAGSTVSGFDFKFIGPSGIVRMERTPADVSGRFSGVVMDGSGIPLRNATVAMLNPQTRFPFVTCTDRNGVFAFLQLPAGELSMAVASAVNEGFRGSGYESIKSPVVIRSGESLYAEIRVRMIAPLEASWQQRPDLYARRGAEARGPSAREGVLRGVPEPTLPLPRTAAQAKVGDSAVLQAFIGTDGALISLHVLSPDADPDLARAALQEVISWSFTPGDYRGEAVQRIGTITVHFGPPQP